MSPSFCLFRTASSPLSSCGRRCLAMPSSVRSFSSHENEGSASATHAFDREFKIQQRNNAARTHSKWQTYIKNDRSASVVSYDYIRDEIAARLVDRLDDIKVDGGFPLALDLGSGAGHIYRSICAEPAIGEGQSGGMGGVQKLVQLDSSKEMMFRDVVDNETDGKKDEPLLCETYRLVASEEDKLPSRWNI